MADVGGVSDRERLQIPDVDQLFEGYRHATGMALRELVEGGLRPVLEAQGFDERRPEIFCRDVNDVVQVAYQRYSAPRLWSSVRFYMGVGIPALTEALGRGDWLDDVGHYLSLFGRQRLSGGRWGDDGWWSLDGNVDLEEEAAELGLVVEAEGLGYFERPALQSSLDMVESVLAGTGLLHMGVPSQALVLALNGERAAALALIEEKLAGYETAGRYGWMVKPLAEARIYIEQEL